MYSLSILLTVGNAEKRVKREREKEGEKIQLAQFTANQMTSYAASHIKDINGFELFYIFFLSLSLSFLQKKDGWLSKQTTTSQCSSPHHRFPVIRSRHILTVHIAAILLFREDSVAGCHHTSIHPWYGKISLCRKRDRGHFGRWHHAKENRVTVYAARPGPLWIKTKQRQKQVTTILDLCACGANRLIFFFSYY